MFTLARFRPYLGLALLLLIAAWLRLGWVGISSFSFDEARVSDMALQMARDGDFASLGMQSSTGVPNFPAAVWLYSLPFALTVNPQIAIWFTGILNLVGVAAIWWLARRLWGEGGAWVAAGLMATSPFLVYYARSVWSQNLLAPLAILWAATAYAAVNGKRGRTRSFFLAAHAFLAGFVGQVHIAGFALLIASAWLFWRYRLWERWAPIVVGGFSALALTIPTIYLISCCGEGARADIARVWAQPSVWYIDAARDLWELMTGDDGTRFWLGNDYVWPGVLDTVVGVIAWGLGALLVLALLWLLIGLIRPGLVPTGTDTRFQGVLLAWALCGLLLFTRGKAPPQIHYQLVAVPALWLMAGGLLHAWRRYTRLWLALFTMIMIVQAVTVVGALDRVSDELVPGGMGTPLRYPQAVVTALSSNGYPIVTESLGSNTAYDGDAALFDVLLRGQPHRLVDGGTSLLIPDEPAHLLFTFASLPAFQIATGLGLDGVWRNYPRRQNEPPYVVLTRQAPARLGRYFTPIQVDLTNGATLLGYRAEPLGEGRRLRLLTYWQITRPPADNHFQQFNHLYLRDGAEPAAVSDIYTSSRAWQQGDHLISWAEFDRPAGELDHFDVGMYSWPDLVRSAVADSGQDVKTAIRIPITLAEVAD